MADIALSKTHRVVGTVRIPTPAANSTWVTAAEVMIALKLTPKSILAAAQHAMTKVAKNSNRAAGWRDDVLGLLRLRGDEYRREIATQLDHLLDANQVAELMGWKTRAAVNKNKLQGRLLAVSIPGRNGDQFPGWQFDGRKIHSWVEPLVANVGNGWPAMQFLLKKRPSLQELSYVDLLMAGAEGIETTMLAQASRIGDMDAGLVTPPRISVAEAIPADIRAHSDSAGAASHA